MLFFYPIDIECVRFSKNKAAVFRFEVEGCMLANVTKVISDVPNSHHI